MGTVFCEGCFCYIATLQNRKNLQVKLFGKFPVPLIMGRNGHDGSCSVAG